MSTDPARDRSTDALLRAALPGLPAGDVAACLSAETLAAWSEGSLVPSEAARADAHLAECGRCQQMLAAFVRTAPVAAAALPFWQRWPRRWLVPVSAVAAAGIMFAIVTRDSAPPRPTEMARFEAPAPAAAPPASADRKASIEPAPGAQRADAVPPASALRSRAGQSPASPADQRTSAPTQGVTGGLAAPPPPVNVSPTAGPIEAPAALKPEAPPPAVGEREELQRLAKQDSPEAANRPAEQYRDNEAIAIRAPAAESDASALRAQRGAAVSGAGASKAIITEIASAPRPPFRGAGRGGRGAASARAAAEDAAAASKLPATIPARWRVLSDGHVERSTNGGATWHEVAVDAPAPLTGGSSPSDLVCWLIGPNGVVLLSTDGVRFTRLPFPETTSLVSITAVNDRAATIRTTDGRTFVTGDGGGSWKEQ